MSSSSSTAPASPQRDQSAGGGHRPGRGRDLAVWAILSVWASLFVFMVIAIFNPPWLQKLSRSGVQTEARGFLDNGDVMLRQRDFPQALRWYSEALRVDPTSVRARVNSAIALVQLGHYRDGEALLREALEESPRQRAVILYNLADLLRREGNKPRAIAQYLDALGQGGDPELGHRCLGELYAETGDLPRARDAYREALRLRDDVTWPYRRMLLEARNTVTDSADVRRVEQALAGRIDESDLAGYGLDILRGQARRDRESARLAGELGALEAGLGERPSAIAHLRRSLEVWPANPRAEAQRALLARMESAAPAGPAMAP